MELLYLKKTIIRSSFLNIITKYAQTFSIFSSQKQLGVKNKTKKKIVKGDAIFLGIEMCAHGEGM